MPKLSNPKYTLVMHSGGGYAGKPGFKRAVEERSLTTQTQVEKIRRVGGLVFDSYDEAASRAESENYPPGVNGLYPNARGRFSVVTIDGLRIYVPAR